MREDATLDECGTFCYLRDSEDRRVWSTTSRPTPPRDDSGAAIFDESPATLLRRDYDGIEVRPEIAESVDDNVELRRLRPTNLCGRRQTLTATSFAEIDLAAPAIGDLLEPDIAKILDASTQEKP